MKKFRHIILALTALILASCAVDEFWEGMDHAEGEEVVMTFKPRFEDFESVTKAIGDASNVDKLLVHVYEGDDLTPYEFDIKDPAVIEDVSIPFFYGKKYTVYFWAYNSDGNAYIIAEGGLKNGVTVIYPDEEQNLAYNALEHLDAFYAVSEDVDLSNGRTIDVNLTRPFAQVNLVAKKNDLAAAQATKVEFTINVAEKFNLTSPTSEGTTPKTFTFTSTDYFQSTEKLNQNTEELNQNTEEHNVDVYLGTTYLFVPSSGKVTGTVKLYAGNNVLKSAENIEIPLVSNKRTNLVFSGFQVTVPDWNPDKVKVPGGDDWITITEPEQLAALLMAGTTENTQVRIGSTLNMEKMPQDVKNKIVDKSFSSLTLDGNNLTIKNFSAPAFFANATNLKVSNLTLENVNITAATHVGVLVNELKGNGTFTNVTVKGSSATTTNGAAGGVVGYIVRNTPTSRSERVSVSFDNCVLSAVIATGSLTDGKFVGRLSGYDNGEVVTFTTTCSAEGGNSSSMSKYVSSNLACWLTDAERSAFNGWIGDEVYYRGKVSYGDTRVAVKWDGTTTVEPLLANATYDSGTTAGTNKFAVYSPFDLAGVRKKTASPAAIYLMNNVDMFGQGQDGRYNVPSVFTESAYNSIDDNKFNSFSYVSTLEGFNHTIYNLKIEHLAQGSTTAAFIGGASGTTYHQNTIFEGCCVVSTHKVVSTDAKAYAAIVCCNPGGTYTMSNITARNCKTFGLQKVGTLCSRVSGTSILESNTVSNSYVENYECNIVERFESGKKTMAGFTIDNVYADFYPQGEVGGMYGFIQGTATLSNCQVIESIVCAYGQSDKMAEIEASGWKGALAVIGLKGLGYYKVPGRHVNAMIGNIRVTGGNITISGCTIDANCKCTRSNDVHNSYYKIIGQAYYVFGVDGTSDPGTVTVDNNKLTLANCNAYTQL